MKDDTGVMIAVNRLDSGLVAEWDDFVRNCPQATFFHLAAWKTVIESTFHHDCYFLYAERGDRICG